MRVPLVEIHYLSRSSLNRVDTRDDLVSQVSRLLVTFGRLTLTLYDRDGGCRCVPECLNLTSHAVYRART